MSQRRLSTYSQRPWFTADPGCRFVTFAAPTDGDTTEGSAYARSELRQMTANGSHAGWDTGAGTHVMVIREAITHLPAGKPSLIAGQIHDTESDMLAIKIAGSRLFVSHGAEDGATLTDGYQLGTTFTIRIVVRDDVTRTFYDGRLADTYRHASSGLLQGRRVHPVELLDRAGRRTGLRAR